MQTQTKNQTAKSAKQGTAKGTAKKIRVNNYCKYKESCNRFTAKEAWESLSDKRQTIICNLLDKHENLTDESLDIFDNGFFKDIIKNKHLSKLEKIIIFNSVATNFIFEFNHFYNQLSK
jgi:hypothetical protein